MALHEGCGPQGSPPAAAGDQSGRLCAQPVQLYEERGVEVTYDPDRGVIAIGAGPCNRSCRRGDVHKARLEAVSLVVPIAGVQTSWGPGPGLARIRFAMGTGSGEAGDGAVGSCPEPQPLGAVAGSGEGSGQP